MAVVFSVDAIIVRTTATRESDVRVTFFAREIGLSDAFATGAKKIISKQRSRLEPGTVTRITIAKGKQFDRLTTSEPFFVPMTIRLSLYRLLGMQFFLGLLYETTRKGDANPALFAWAMEMIRILEDIEDAPTAVESWCATVAQGIMETNGFSVASGKPLRAQMEYVFEKQLTSWKLLDCMSSDR